jgi:putative effector of murein hydrolase LrgA (UPF0299 family)
MVYFELISAHWLPLTVATLVSTLAVLATTGLTAKFFMRRKGSYEH